MNKTKKYGGVTLEVINSKDPLTPTKVNKVILSKTDKHALGLAVKENLPALLIGEAGTAKTSAVKELAYITQRPFVIVNMNGFTTPDELIGSKSVKNGATYYENGIVTDAMQRGAIITFEEINATNPDCLFILHSLLDENRRITLPNGDIITPHKDFRVFATCNPDYEGTRAMNKAFIDRFPIVLDIKTLSPTKEIKLLTDREGLDKDTANALVIIATKVRKEYIDGKILNYVSTRSLLSTAHLIKSGLEVKDAYTVSIVQKSNDYEERRLLTDIFLSVYKQAEGKTVNDYLILEQSIVDDYKNRIKILQDDYSIALDNSNKLTTQVTNLESDINEVKSNYAVLESLKENIASELQEAKDKIQGYENLKKILQKASTDFTE